MEGTTCWTFTGDSLKGQGGKTKPDIVVDLRRLVVTEPAAFRRQLGLNGGTRVLANAKGVVQSGWMPQRKTRLEFRNHSQCGKKRVRIACHIALAYDWIPNQLHTKIDQTKLKHLPPTMWRHSGGLGGVE